MAFVEFEHIDKQYPKAKNLSVEDFNLKIEKGEFIVFVGPSGCGKSTTLRMLAGLEEISSGTIKIDEKVVNDVHPKDRDIAMVFQNYALYPHMTVYDNIAFGLKIKKVPKDEIREKITDVSKVLGLEEYLERKPKDLSGGQRQRVALGRAIVRNPKVFLMDEPLSNLDAKLRVTMRNEITRLHKELEATTIYVTHDQVEAMTMADRIVVMKDGIIQQIGSPIELYKNPVNTFVASFIGTPQMNIIEGNIKKDQLLLGDNIEITLPEGIIKKNKLGDGKVKIGIRPEHCSNEKIKLDSFPISVAEFRIEALELMGSENNVYTKIGNQNFTLKLSSSMSEGLGDMIKIHLDVNKMHFFDFNTGLNLGVNNE